MSAQTLAFQAEMNQMMDIIIHSLYSKKEIFLRELLSNASDAIDKLRYEALTKPEFAAESATPQIRLIPDEAAMTLTIRDNGIGLDVESAIANLGTVARSGTKEFLKRLSETDAKDRPDLIGQFGLGFYAAFMVADKVTVLSRQAGKEKGVRWESDGKGAFEVEEIDKPAIGTDVILHMKDDAKEYLDEWRLRELVRTYSDFIAHSIVMEVEEQKEDKTKERHDETLNRGQAIWQRSKSEVKDEEYKEFYKHLTRDYEDPLRWVHYAAEGTLEFKALLYFPRQRPFDFLWPDRKHGLSLYIRRVFITDDSQAFLPPYLRFVRGVLDAADLPLNVSREMLQKNPVSDAIRTNLVSKVLGALADLKNDSPDDYATFFKAFGIALKEGVYTDWANKAKLADLLLFECASKPVGTTTTLKDYVAAMPEGQSDIYFLIGENRGLLERSPYLEGLRAKGYDVLLLTEPIDEWMMGALSEYEGKKLKAADKVEATEAPKPEGYDDFLAYVGGFISEVKGLRLSSRLVDSAACLVSEEGQMGAYMESVMKKLGAAGELGQPTKSERYLELNPKHEVVTALKALFERDKNDLRLGEYARLLYEQAVLAEGSKLEDPRAMAERVNRLLTKDLKA